MRKFNKREKDKLLRLLPDKVEYLNPIWLLSSGRCTVYGNLNKKGVEFACISSGKRPDAWIYGSPTSEELTEWLRQYEQKVDFIGSSSLKDLLRRNVDYKKADYIDYHVFESESTELKPGNEAEVGLLGMNELESFKILDEEGKSFFDLWQSIEEALDETIVYGVIKLGKIISFALLLPVTEKYMEIGVWTKKSRRRQGLSYACSIAIIERILMEGKTPVWGAERGNIASIALAEKLGFNKVCEYYWVTPIEEERV